MIIFVLWFIQLVLHKSVIGYQGEDLLWIRVSDIWSRYIMAFPAGILAGYAIFAQRDEFRKYGQTRFIKMLKLAAASLLTYGIVGGIIVPEGPVSLATHLNSEMFFSFTGVPIELLRAIVGFLVAFSMLKIIQVFDKEYIYRIQESEKEKAILEERNRIAQDLHDGIIQSMYATNLQLEVAKHLMTTNLEEAKGKLTLSISRSNAIISQIRQYIGELKRVTETRVSLKERINELLDEMGIRNQLKIKFDCSYDKDELSITVFYHLTLITKEAISNVLKHSEANELRITGMKVV